MKRRKWQKPRSSAVADVVIDAYARHGAMTIDQCAQVTGLHTERIRRVVKQPRFAVVKMAETMPPSRVWELKGESQ